MADPSAFFRWVLPYAATCPDPVAESHVIDAAREFCSKTRCWRHKISITLDGTEENIPAVPTSAILFELEKASFNSQQLDRVSFAFAEFGGDGVPRAITQAGNSTVRLAPRAQAGTLELSVFAIPKVNAMDLPDFLLDQHGRDIAFGALSTILALPDQPFTDPRMAAYYLAKFTAATDAGFNINLRGQQRAPVRTRPRSF